MLIFPFTRKGSALFDEEVRFIIILFRNHANLVGGYSCIASQQVALVVSLT